MIPVINFENEFGIPCAGGNAVMCNLAVQIPFSNHFFLHCHSDAKA